MEIDLVSTIIGITALSTFLVPIGLYQLSEKRKKDRLEKAFNDAAKKNNLHIDEMELLRNEIAIGLNLQNRLILHIQKGKDTLLNLKKIKSCKLYKQEYREKAESGSLTITVEIGIQATHFHDTSLDNKFPLFQANEGNIYGDEYIITNKWINKMNTLIKRDRLD